MVGPDNHVWLIGERYWNADAVDALLRFDGIDWTVVTVPALLGYAGLGQSIDVGTDGTLWAARGGSGQARSGLARLDDAGWTVFEEADGVQPWGATSRWIASSGDLLHVAPDGSVWLNAHHDGSTCGGVANYDGTRWDTYLAGLCVHDIDVAHDGAVWVQAGTFGSSSGLPDLYVILPEAMAVTE